MHLTQEIRAPYTQRVNGPYSLGRNNTMKCSFQLLLRFCSNSIFTRKLIRRLNPQSGGPMPLLVRFLTFGLSGKGISAILVMLPHSFQNFKNPIHSNTISLKKENKMLEQESRNVEEWEFDIWSKLEIELGSQTIVFISILPHKPKYPVHNLRIFCKRSLKREIIMRNTTCDLFLVMLTQSLFYNEGVL